MSFPARYAPVPRFAGTLGVIATDSARWIADAAGVARTENVVGSDPFLASDFRLPRKVAPRYVEKSLFRRTKVVVAPSLAPSTRPSVYGFFPAPAPSASRPILARFVRSKLRIINRIRNEHNGDSSAFARPRSDKRAGRNFRAPSNTSAFAREQRGKD